MNTVQRTNTNYDGGADVIYGQPPLVYRNVTSPLAIKKAGLTSLSPTVVIPPPTAIIPFKAPDLPTSNQLVSGLKPSTVAIPSAPLQDAQPIKDPVIGDKIYTPVAGTPSLNNTGSLLAYRNQVLSAIRTPAPANASLWIWLAIAAALAFCIYYYSKKS